MQSRHGLVLKGLRVKRDRERDIGKAPTDCDDIGKAPADGARGPVVMIMLCAWPAKKEDAGLD